jgi:hypothetical protein
MNICYPISFHYEAPALIPKSGYPLGQAIDLTSLVKRLPLASSYRISDHHQSWHHPAPTKFSRSVSTSRVDAQPDMRWEWCRYRHPHELQSKAAAISVHLARKTSQDALQRVRRRLVAEDATVASDDDHTVSSGEDDSGDEDDDSGLRKTPLPFVLRLGYPQEG